MLNYNNVHNKHKYLDYFLLNFDLLNFWNWESQQLSIPLNTIWYLHRRRKSKCSFLPEKKIRSLVYLK